MITDLIHAGDKVDIRIVNQVANVEQTGISPHIYKSQVNEFIDEGVIQITMPIEKGKVILLPLDTRFEFVFYTNNGLYYSIGLVKERYKEDNVYLVDIELHSPLKKFQRREYYRYPCLLDLQFYVIDGETAQTKTTEEIFKMFCNDSFFEKQKNAKILDMSGGGIRIVGDEILDADSYIFLVLRLANERMDKQYYMKGHVLASERMIERSDKVETRIQFIFQDNRVREEIIKYIFEEERKNKLKN